MENSEREKLKEIRDKQPMVKLARYIDEITKGEKVLGHYFVSESNGRCVGCGYGSTSSLVIKTDKGEHKVPVDGNCYADFQGTLLTLRVENELERIDERVKKNSEVKS